MLQKLRQILLTQYIGAVVTALVAGQCLQTLLTLILSFIWHYVVVWRTPTGVLGESLHQDFDWTRAIYSLINILLNAAVVYGLIRWLYFGRRGNTLPEKPEPQPPAPEAPPLNS